MQPCLYTHQKTKKSKTWSDGMLRVFGPHNVTPHAAVALCRFSHIVLQGQQVSLFKRHRDLMQSVGSALDTTFLSEPLEAGLEIEFDL